MLGLIVGSTILFYLVIFLLDIPITQVSDGGWLLGPFPEGGLWQPFTPANLARIQWSAIVDQAGNIAAIIIISAIALLLNAGGIELSVKRDIQLDRELQSSGLATIGSGLVGGLVSFPAISLTILGQRIGGSSRWLNLVTAFSLGVILLLGPKVLAYAPKIVFGGLLTYLGLSLLEEWVYKAWFKFSRLDFFIIFTIMLVIAAIGFLEGVALGILLSVALFVINYSQINVVKHTLSGASYSSRVTRRRAQRELLAQRGEEIYILQVQGFIFFGTATKLLNQVRQRIDAPDLPSPRYIVLDFRQVTGLDSTATLSFTKMKQIAQARNITLVFTNPSIECALPLQDDSVAKLLAQLAEPDQPEPDQIIRIFPDLDLGLGWCEDQLFLAAGHDLDRDHETLYSQLRALLPNADQLENIAKYFERLEVDPGYYLMKQGEQPDALYFIESGQVTAQIEYPDRAPIRLETMGGGRVVGEIGFYLNKPRTAAVVTDQPAIIFRLSQDALKRMEQHDPEAASAFHQAIIRLVAERLTHLIDTVAALQR